MATMVSNLHSARRAAEKWQALPNIFDHVVILRPRARTDSNSDSDSTVLGFDDHIKLDVAPAATEYGLQLKAAPYYSQTGDSTVARIVEPRYGTIQDLNRQLRKEWYVQQVLKFLSSPGATLSALKAVDFDVVARPTPPARRQPVKRAKVNKL